MHGHVGVCECLCVCVYVIGTRESRFVWAQVGVWFRCPVVKMKGLCGQNKMYGNESAA